MQLAATRGVCCTSTLRETITVGWTPASSMCSCNPDVSETICTPQAYVSVLSCRTRPCTYKLAQSRPCVQQLPAKWVPLRRFLIYRDVHSEHAGRQLLAQHTGHAEYAPHCIRSNINARCGRGSSSTGRRIHLASIGPRAAGDPLRTRRGRRMIMLRDLRCNCITLTSLFLGLMH